MKPTHILVPGRTSVVVYRRLLEIATDPEVARVGGLLWLAPSRRLFLCHRSALTAAGTTRVELFTTTLADWCEEVIAAWAPEYRPLTRGQQRLLLEEIVEEAHRGEELQHFRAVLETRGFNSGLRDLIAELKRLGVGPRRFVQAAYDRGYTGRIPARTILGQSIASKDRECARLYARYDQRLTQQRLVDLEGRPMLAARLLREYGLPPRYAQVHSVILAGFTDWTPAQHSVLAELGRHLDRLWIGLIDDPEDDREDLFVPARTAATALLLATGADATTDPCSTAVASGETDERPPGLQHLQRELFRPLRAIRPAPDAAGLALIEAPGRLGEARLVFREVVDLLARGTPAHEILLVVREVKDHADLLDEVAREYRVPLDIEGCTPLHRIGLIATILRALRLPLEGWPFAGTTALLRSSYLRPPCPEFQTDPEIASRSEVLLRLLGEPRDRDAYLRAVARWETAPPTGLEDEQAEESRRRRTHELAQQCGPFLRRFFTFWDGQTGTKRVRDHLTWLQRFLRAMGFDETARRAPQDAQALQCLLTELHAWQQRLEVTRTDHPLDATHFLRRLVALVSVLGLPRTPRGPGRVAAAFGRTGARAVVRVCLRSGAGRRELPQPCCHAVF